MKTAVFTLVCFLAFTAGAQDDENRSGTLSDEPTQESAQSQTYVAVTPDASESGIVRAVLQSSGLTGVLLEDIAVFADGRIVKLNLDNPAPGQSGIKQLPSDFSKLTALTELTINDNDLVSLPDGFGKLVALRKLEIRNNSLVALPSTIGGLGKLEELDLRNNQLTILPIEIGLCGHLWKLQLWGNALRALPETIGSLSALRELYVRNNRLTTFPKSAMKLKLGYLDMQENRLCEVPADIDLWLKKFDVKYRSWQKCW